MLKQTAKVAMEYLMKVEKRLDEFDDQPLTPQARKALFGAVKELTNPGHGQFFRKDNGKVVQLYWNSESLEHGMSPDITITVTNNIIKVDTWKLWKTITGYNEIIQEH